jgi:hypothetical protein
MGNKVGRKWLFIHLLDDLQEVGDTKKLNLPFQRNTIHCSIYKYKMNKKVNPKGRAYSVRPLGCNEYLFTLIKKGS